MGSTRKNGNGKNGRKNGTKKRAKAKRVRKTARINGGKTVRNGSGQFAPGTAGGPGRPSRAVEEYYLGLIASGCSEADFLAIVRKAVKQAKKGDPAARKWIADYLVGKPIEKHEIKHEADQTVAAFFGRLVEAEAKGLA